jgi:hypothetical protein
VFDVFDLKLGKLMIGPSSLAKHTASPKEGEQKDQSAVRELQNEIEVFYVALEKRMGALVSSHILPCLRLNEN